MLVSQLPYATAGLLWLNILGSIFLDGMSWNASGVCDFQLRYGSVLFAQ
jgi:hypothetical protein